MKKNNVSISTFLKNHSWIFDLGLCFVYLYSSVIFYFVLVGKFPHILMSPYDYLTDDHFFVGIIVLFVNAFLGFLVRFICFLIGLYKCRKSSGSPDDNNKNESE